MIKLVVSLAVGAMLFALCSMAAAQPLTTSATIGWLATRSAASGTGLDRLRRHLRSLGYVEGKNIVFEFRSADDKIDRLPALADDLVRRKVDVIVTPSTAEALAAQSTTKTIPIVCLNVGDAVALGLVNSLAQPGGNITGFSNITAVTAGKRLELLKEAIPKLSRVAVLWYPKDSGSTPQWQESQRAGEKLGVQVHSMAIGHGEDYESAFRQATRLGSEALAVTQGPLSISNQRHIAELAIRYRVPTMMPRGDLVESGGLMSYGPDRDESYRRVAAMIDKILKGAKPADLPVEQPTKFELVINLKTAKQIGLTVPPAVLARADRIIK